MNIRYATIQDLNEIASIEAKCYPEAEGATLESFQKRLESFPNHFWLLEIENQIVSYVNGMVTDISWLQDIMYEDASMHNEEGAWQMVFGVATLPEYQHLGYASKLMSAAIDDCKKQGKKGMILTCKDELLSFYEQFGFVNEGISISRHGGVSWNDMRLVFDIID